MAKISNMKQTHNYGDMFLVHGMHPTKKINDSVIVVLTPYNGNNHSYLVK